MGHRQGQLASDLDRGAKAAGLLGQVRCGTRESDETASPPEAGEAGLRRGVHALPLPRLDFIAVRRLLSCHALRTGSDGRCENQAHDVQCAAGLVSEMGAW